MILGREGQHMMERLAQDLAKAGFRVRTRQGTLNHWILSVEVGPEGDRRAISAARLHLRYQRELAGYANWIYKTQVEVIVKNLNHTPRVLVAFAAMQEAAMRMEAELTSSTRSST